MWVVNNNKERIKSYINNDIESNITNITNEINRIHDLIASINRATAGTASGADRVMIDDCQRALNELSITRQNLFACKNYASQLETREWIPDE